MSHTCVGANERKLIKKFGGITRVLRGSRGLLPLLAVALALVAAPASVRAQSNADGYITGTVKVAQASDLTDVQIIARNKDTGVERSVKAGADGTYRISSLPVGDYEVILRRPGAADMVRDDVSVSLGSGSNVPFSMDGSDETMVLDTLRVDGTAVTPINVTQTETVSLYRAELINKLPVVRDVASVALLAPGTVRGEAAFDTTNLQKLASFGGASVAENAYFINGFNVTNFRNGLGGSTVPFAFYDEFQVKTGGYSAEFGRSMGGVINTTTKRGGNSFHGGVNVFYEPEALNSNTPNVLYEDGTPYRINSEDHDENLNLNAYLSGPIWKDHIFFYGIYNVRQNREKDVLTEATQFDDAKNNDPFWGGKLDIQLNSDHLIELTGFSDKRDRVATTYEYDYPTNTIGALVGEGHEKRGGKNVIARYTGQFTDNFSITALYGNGKYDLTTASSADEAAYIYDETLTPLGTWVNPQVSTADDERTAYRLDANLRLGKHNLRFGYDTEDNTSNDLTTYSGGVYWRYYNIPASGRINGTDIPAGTTSIVRERIYNVGGTFSVKETAYYLEDNFSLMDDRLTLNVGLRNESFQNDNKEGNTFVKIDDQLAPRLGFSYATGEDRRSKVFGSYGRYYLPVASNTNVRASGGELFTEEYYQATSRGADGVPTKGAKIGGTNVYSDGSVPDYRTLVNLDLKPMFQEEYILGFQTEFRPNWTFGIRGVYRDLAVAMDDVDVAPALQSYADRNGITAYEADGAAHYAITNPGQDLRMFWDMNGDGSLEEILLTNDDFTDEVGNPMPVAVRKYYALEFMIEKVFSDHYFFQASYTWSQSYGNTEGYVRSDLAQDDAGITASFDYPSLMVNSWGFLPNDRRHSFKAYGAYQVNEKLQIGANVLIQSGRAINALGNNPDGSSSYAGDYYEIPQGSGGRTPTIYYLDLSFQYQLSEGVRLGADIFNVFDFDRNLQVYETRTDSGGNPEPKYGLPTFWQSPRSVRLWASYEF